MTIDEAILHAEEVAERHEEIKRIKAVTSEECKCAAEHRQLAEWLKELKKLRQKDAQIKDAISECKMQKLAQDEISSFEYGVLKIYGVME